MSFSSPLRFSDSFRIFFFIPISLALSTSLSIIFYISVTSNFFHYNHHQTLPIFINPSISSPKIPPLVHKTLQFPSESRSMRASDAPATIVDRPSKLIRSPFKSNGNNVNKEVFHDKSIFLEDYKEMNRSFKIYVYPHRKTDPFANVLLPVAYEPGGNYASESYFKKVLMDSHFITNKPSEAQLFFLPFSIASLRHDRRIGIGGIKKFIRNYMYNISQNYPYWNTSGGADHFYVACHSIGRSAMEKASKVKFNAIQLVCSSSYYLTGYISHKDASLPQIWPRKDKLPQLAFSKRKKLAFFAGAVNSQVRKNLLQSWKNDSEIFVHQGRLKTPYSTQLLGSKFCIHAKGFEVNTARVADSLYYGCVPVIIADYYDLPFVDVLDWKSFSLVITTAEIPRLKEILRRVSKEDYAILSKNVMKVRKHFQWHLSPVDYDAFYMAMHELWLRRSVVRIPVSGSLGYHGQCNGNSSKFM